MFDRLLNGQARAGQLLTDLRIFAITLAEIAAFKVGRRRELRSYPFRCQHCSARVRIATDAHPSARRRGLTVYRDRAGHYSCDGTIRMLHQPMPPIR